MHPLPNSIIITVALLTVFFVSIVALTYAVENSFARTRLIMTAFFFFIIATLTISFWEYTRSTLPYTVPAWMIGIVLGYVIGARGAQQRLREEGLEHYVQHFAHIDIKTFKDVTWWTVLNFYTVGGALILINLVGFSTVILENNERWAVITSTAGAFLIGSIVPYLTHLWNIRIKSSTK